MTCFRQKGCPSISGVSFSYPQCALIYPQCALIKAESGPSKPAKLWRFRSGREQAIGRRLKPCVRPIIALPCCVRTRHKPEYDANSRVALLYRGAGWHGRNSSSSRKSGVYGSWKTLKVGRVNGRQVGAILRKQENTTYAMVFMLRTLPSATATASSRG